MRKSISEKPKESIIGHLGALSNHICGNQEPYGKCDIWASKLANSLNNLNFKARVFASGTYEFQNTRGGITYGHSITVACTQNGSEWIAVDLSFRQIKGQRTMLLAQATSLEDLCSHISHKLPGFIRYNPSLEEYFR